MLALALSGKFDFAVSAALLEEYEGVLSRSRFKLSSGIVSATMARIRRLAVSVDPRERLNVTRDPSDNMVLECAVEASSQYLVTGNSRDFPAEFRGIKVLPPKQFLIVLAANLE